MPALTYLERTGEWGIKGVDMSTLPPKVYGALCKLKDLEHPRYGTNLERLAALDLDGAAQFLAVIVTVAALSETPLNYADVKERIKAGLDADIDPNRALCDLVQQWITEEQR